MQFQFTRKALKAFTKLDASIQARVYAKIKAYAQDPGAHANVVTPLRGGIGYRLRVGDYRVLFTVDDGPPQVMVVYRVAHRREAYDG